MKKINLTIRQIAWIVLVAMSVVVFSNDALSQQNHTKKTTNGKASLPPLDIQAIENILGMKGTEKDGQYKVTVPQNDLNIEVDGFKIIPPMGLGS